MDDQPTNIAGILDRLEDAARDQTMVSVGRIVEAFGHRSYGPFLIVPALIEISPIGGIPGVPTFLAAVIFLFAIQMVVGRKHLWLPSFIADRSVPGDKLATAADKLRPISRRLDHWFHGRLPLFTTAPFVRGAAGLCALITLTVPPLELVPFASTLPMLAIAMFGMALLVRDGALYLAAATVTVASLGVGAWLWYVR